MIKNLLRAIDKKNYITLVLVFMIIELANIVLMRTVVNILITIPQFFIVFFYIKKDVKTAFLLHVLFTLTAFDNTSAEYAGDMYSYSECKLVGPFTLTYINLGMIWINVRKKREIVADTLLVYFKKIIIILFIIAFTIGIWGLFLLNYRFIDFFVPFNYLSIAFIYIDILCGINDTRFQKRAYVCAICLIIAAPIATFISYFVFHLHSTYSGFDALLVNEEYLLAPLMLLFLLCKTTPRYITLFSIFLYFVCIATASRGGAFYDIAAAMVACVYIIYFVQPGMRLLKTVIPLLLFVIITLFLGFTFENADNLAVLKFNDFFTLFTTLGTLNLSAISADNIAMSPYIRVSEVFNIVGCGIDNPLAFIFGRGFGGQYTDITQMFSQIDMSEGMGAFTPEVVKSGRYGYAHSFLPMILLWSGLLGLFYLVKIGIKYIRRIKISPLYFAAFLLFFHSFYFNPSIFLAVVFALYGANYVMKKDEYVVKNERDYHIV